MGGKGIKEHLEMKSELKAGVKHMVEYSSTKGGGSDKTSSSGLGAGMALRVNGKMARKIEDKINNIEDYIAVDKLEEEKKKLERAK